MKKLILTLNMAVRFVLEILALYIFGFYGWQQFAAPNKYLSVFIFPFLAASIWGVFNVPNDPSRSGKAPVIVKGWLRLLIEITFFGLATLALIVMGFRKQGLFFTAITVIHYLISYKRIIWLINR